MCELSNKTWNNPTRFNSISVLKYLDDDDGDDVDNNDKRLQILSFNKNHINILLDAYLTTKYTIIGVPWSFCSPFFPLYWQLTANGYIVVFKFNNQLCAFHVDGKDCTFASYENKTKRKFWTILFDKLLSWDSFSAELFHKFRFIRNSLECVSFS